MGDKGDKTTTDSDRTISAPAENVVPGNALADVERLISLAVLREVLEARGIDPIVKLPDLNEVTQGEFELPRHLTRVRRLLSDESDRGCALLAAAYLDEELARLLKGFFIDDERLAGELLGSDGVVGTFSSRINLCLALGLLSGGCARNLHLQRKVRNKFAHLSEELTFGSSPIKDWCRELDLELTLPEQSERATFITSIMTSAARIHGAIKLNARRVAAPHVRLPVGREPFDLSDEVKELLALHLKQSDE
jgi:DNA-binding MltR family transcriptional regulator